MLLLILKINGNAQHLNRVDNIQVVSLIGAYTHQARTDFLVSKRKNEKKMGGKGKRNRSSNLKRPVTSYSVSVARLYLVFHYHIA